MIDIPNIFIDMEVSDTTLSKLASLDMSAFKEGGIQALSKSLGLVSDGTASAENTAKQLIGLFQ